MSATMAVTEQTFETEVLNAQIPVLVDFWAEWCGPCKMVAPVLETIALEYKDKLKVVKVDVDANPAVAAKYSIRGIPTLLLIKDGNVVMTKVGALTKTQLSDMLAKHL